MVDEENIRNAIASIRSGVSISESARRFSVPRSTVRNRLKGTTTHAAAAESLQRLSKTQEENLCGWVLTEKAAGNRPTQRQVHEMARRMLARTGDVRGLGKNWVVGFQRRNPKLRAQGEWWPGGMREDKLLGWTETNAVQESIYPLKKWMRRGIWWPRVRLDTDFGGCDYTETCVYGLYVWNNTKLDCGDETCLLLAR